MYPAPPGPLIKSMVPIKKFLHDKLHFIQYRSDGGHLKPYKQRDVRGGQTGQKRQHSATGEIVSLSSLLDASWRSSDHCWAIKLRILMFVHLRVASPPGTRPIASYTALENRQSRRKAILVFWFGA